MGSIGTAEVVVVLIAALLILGPQKLPGAARQVGKAFAEFRRMANGFQADIKDAFSEDDQPPRYDPPASTTQAIEAGATDAPRRDTMPAAAPDDPSRN